MRNGIEYHNPLGSSYYVSLQHVERYRFALTHLSSGQRVLDIACGAGYGTAMISQYGCEVIGADYDDESISTAKASWPHETFVEANALELPFEDCSFDVVVSYETIEHVSAGDQFLSEMHRVLKPGGTFICSTPNVRYTVHPDYHLKEYEAVEFYELVRRRFIEVGRYAQYFKPSDRLRDVYRWRLYGRIVSLLEKTRLKTTLKRLLQKSALKTENSIEGAGADLDHILRSSPDADYDVRPLAGLDWLRIMVVVARKEAGV